MGSLPLAPAPALLEVMRRELTARGEKPTSARIAEIVGVTGARIRHADSASYVRTDTLAEWCRRWEAAGYPALTFVVGRDGSWAGRADEVPPEVVELLE